MSPSTQQPPGKRTNAGFNPASISARSGRRPFGRCFQVCLGKSDTMSSQNVPARLVLMTKRALGSVAFARQREPVILPIGEQGKKWSSAHRRPRLRSPAHATSGPVNPSPPRAKSES